MRGGTRTLAPAPTPQEEELLPATAVRIQGGFFVALPPRALTFFERIYFVRMPVPLIPAVGAPSFPRTVAIFRIQLKPTQVLVLKDVVFTAYRAAGVDPDDSIPLTPLENKRLAGYVGYSFTIGDRGVADFNSNIGGQGYPPGTVQQQPPPVQGPPIVSSSAPSTLFPFQGSLRADFPEFASYGMPGQVVQAFVVVLRPPPFELKRFSVEVAGYWMNETTWNALLNGQEYQGVQIGSRRY